VGAFPCGCLRRPNIEDEAARLAISAEVVHHQDGSFRTFRLEAHLVDASYPAFLADNCYHWQLDEMMTFIGGSEHAFPVTTCQDKALRASRSVMSCFVCSHGHLLEIAASQQCQMRFFVTILLIGLDVSDFAGEKPIYKM
jgi:hypothetical protein